MMAHTEADRREHEEHDRWREMDHCTGSSLTGAGQGAPKHVTVVWDYMADWVRRHLSHGAS
jgi:hypothetical protein